MLSGDNHSVQRNDTIVSIIEKEKTVIRDDFFSIRSIVCHFYERSLEVATDPVRTSYVDECTLL